MDSSRPTDVAIIGMACRFPGAPDPESFWRNLREGVESIRFFTDEELEASGVAPSLRENPLYVPARGHLEGALELDAPFFGLSPREAELTDPQHRLFLEVSWEALERAGKDPAREPGTIGVFAGCSPNAYLLNHLARGTDTSEPVATIPLMVHSDKDYLAARTAYKLDLRGPALTVQAACSTSLAAVHLAIQSLLEHESDVVLAGGASLYFPRRSGYLYEEGQVCSPDGHCRAFDAAAAGTVGGEGAGVVVLRRLADARAARDPIVAVIRGSAVNNDGAGKASFTAPTVRGQAEVVAMALEVAGVEPAGVGYVEAHGTATRLGDPIEVAALSHAFRSAARRSGPCRLGSVKSNIGHLDAAAGVAGLIKTALALQHGEIPPSLHFERPNPEIDFAAGPFRVATELTPWPGPAPHRAGVSSFGMGGTNVHVVLEEAPPRAAPEPSREWHLLPVSARTPAALDAARRRLAHFLEKRLEERPEISLADVAHTLQAGRRAFRHRLAVVAREPREAAAALAAAPLPGAADRDDAGADPAPGGELPARPVSREELAAAARRWEAGGDLGAAGLYEGEARSIVVLPTYPFERRRYLAAAPGAAPGSPEGAPPRPAARADFREWFSVPAWRQLPRPGPPPREDASSLVFVDRGGRGEGLVQALRRRGGTTVVVRAGSGLRRLDDGSWELDPAAADDYVRLFEELRRDGDPPPGRLIHLWSLDTPPAAPDRELLEAGLRSGLYSLMRLARALAPAAGSRRLHLEVVCEGLAEVVGGDATRPLHATLLGICRTLPAEHPEVACRLHDLPARGAGDAPRPGDGAGLLERLVDELARPVADPWVAYRGRHRWVRDWVPVELPEPGEAGSGLRERGVYLITGGLGGIGLSLAEEMARTVRARLVLTGRSRMPSAGERAAAGRGELPDAPASWARLAELERAGAEVMPLTADVTDREAMRSVVERTLARWGALHGVIHAAGRAGGRLVALQTEVEAGAVLAPKLLGTLVLHEVLAPAEPDFVLLCSSVAAHVSQAGQMDYCAANAFLDAFVRSAAARGRARWISVAWDAWRDVGIAAETGLPDDLERIRRRELAGAIRPEEGRRAFAAVLASGAGEVAVSPRGLPGRSAAARGPAGEHPAGGRGPEAAPAGAEAAAGARHERPTLSTAWVAPEGERERLVADVFQEVLGVDGVGVTDDFFELGGHSMIASRIAARLRDRAGVDLSIGDVLSTATVRSLAELVAGRERGKGDG